MDTVAFLSSPLTFRGGVPLDRINVTESMASRSPGRAAAEHRVVPSSVQEQLTRISDLERENFNLYGHRLTRWWWPWWWLVRPPKLEDVTF